jgi:hypothetical protein
VLVDFTDCQRELVQEKGLDEYEKKKEKAKPSLTVE